MKRIFSIFLCAVIIAALFVTPLATYAADDDSIVGTWVFNDTITYPGAYTFSIEYTSGGYEFNEISIDEEDPNTSNYRRFIRYNGSVVKYPYTFKRGSNVTAPIGWSNEDYKVVTITGGDDVYNETFITLLRANATKQGSYNSLLDYAKAIAEEESDRYPYYAIVRVSDYEYLVIRAAGAMSSLDGENVTGYAMQANTVRSVDGEYTKNQYWNSMSTDETWTGDLIYANHTIENFPLPLHLRIAKLVGRVIPQFSQTVGGNLMTLTLCGVGCLTLLVVLALLFKTLRTYLPR